MKKIAKLSMLVLIVLLVAATVVSAATKADLKANVEALVKKLNLERSYTAEIDKVFEAAGELDETKVADIQEYLDAVDAKLAEVNYDTSKLDKADKDELLKDAQAAAEIAGLEVVPDYTNKALDVYKDGKLVVPVSYNTNLAQTGSNNLVFAGLAVVAVIAVAATVVVNKAKANA